MKKSSSQNEISKQRLGIIPQPASSRFFRQVLLELPQHVWESIQTPRSCGLSTYRGDRHVSPIRNHCEIGVESI